MNNTIDITNFTGKFAISTGDYREDQFNDYIAEKQDFYLKYFLGTALYRELETYYDNPPAPESRWDNFLDGVDYVSDTTGELEVYKGFKDLLVKLVYADWIIDSRIYFNETGGFDPSNENSRKISLRNLKNKSNIVFNEAVCDQKVMLDFLYTNQLDYNRVLDFFKLLNLRGLITKTLY